MSSPTPSPRSGTPRLQFIDAARATAMVFVFLAHFADSYFRSGGQDPPELMRDLTLIASPTFLVISGVMIGFLWRTRKADFGRLRARFIDRGLFLLTIGHLLISGPYLMRSHSVSMAWKYLFTTDVIGICMLIEPWLVTVVRPRWRLAVAVVGIAASWVLVAMWHPHSLLADAMKETFFGSRTPVLYVYAFPLLPWFGLDLAGTVLGEALGDLSLRGDEAGMQRLLFSVGAAAIFGAVALKLAFIASRVVIQPTLFLYAVTSPFQKNPPSPVYLLFYSGIGIGGILGACLFLERKRAAWLPAAAALGQTSLVMFVTQSYVYYTGIYLLRPHLSAELWPLWLAISIVAVVVPSALWYRLGLNKYITIGYRSLWERRAALRLVEATPA